MKMKTTTTKKIKNFKVLKAQRIENKLLLYWEAKLAVQL